MTSEEARRYNHLVFDGARDIAVRYSHDADEMFRHLAAEGATWLETKYVIWMMYHPDYKEIEYRGAMCDEGTIEALKEFLRRKHGFK